MLRFSIREILLLTLAVACVVGWWTDRARSSAECKRLAEQLGRLQVEFRKSSGLADWLQARCDVLAEETSRLEGDNSRMERRMLDHNTRVEPDFQKFQRLARGS
jgi:hypothetical protein